MTAEPIRVIVADDQELVRTGFCVILDAADGITVVWGGPGQAAQKAAVLSELLSTHARYYDVSDPNTAVTGR
jgi:DNA-binding NarL/FixJ family response regulator